MAAGAQLKAMEERISKLREAGLDADPDVSGRGKSERSGRHTPNLLFHILGFVPRRKTGLEVEHLADRGRGC